MHIYWTDVWAYAFNLFLIGSTVEPLHALHKVSNRQARFSKERAL